MVTFFLNKKLHVLFVWRKNFNDDDKYINVIRENLHCARLNKMQYMEYTYTYSYGTQIYAKSSKPYDSSAIHRILVVDCYPIDA